MAAHHWTCQRQTLGVKCKARNPAIKRKCHKCGKTRPARKRPTHLAVLDSTTYEECVKRFGEQCGICGTKPKPGKKLHRDHEHKGNGRIRGLLCFPCNSALRAYMTVEWLRKALAYLQRRDDTNDPPCTGPGFAHKSHGRCPGYTYDRT